MTFDTEQAIHELSLDDDRERLAPVVAAVTSYQRSCRVRAAVTRGAALASLPVVAMLVWPELRTSAWRGVSLLVLAAAGVLLAWAAARAANARRALRRIVARRETG